MEDIQAIGAFAMELMLKDRISEKDMAAIHKGKRVPPQVYTINNKAIMSFVIQACINLQNVTTVADLKKHPLFKTKSNKSFSDFLFGKKTKIIEFCHEMILPEPNEKFDFNLE